MFSSYQPQEDAGVEEEDDFMELAYFKTWVTVRNTLQQVSERLTRVCAMMLGV